MKILIIENSLTAMENARRILEKDGYDVMATCDEAEGIALAYNGQPDIILLSLMMADRPSDGILGILKRSKSTGGIKVLAYSSSKIEEALPKFDGFVEKTPGLENLVMEIESTVK